MKIFIYELKKVQFLQIKRNDHDRSDLLRNM